MNHSIFSPSHKSNGETHKFLACTCERCMITRNSTEDDSNCSAALGRYSAWRYRRVRQVRRVRPLRQREKELSHPSCQSLCWYPCLFLYLWLLKKPSRRKHRAVLKRWAVASSCNLNVSYQTPLIADSLVVGLGRTWCSRRQGSVFLTYIP